MIGHGTGRPQRSVSGGDATTTTALAAGAGRRGGRRGCWALVFSGVHATARYIRTCAAPSPPTANATAALRSPANFGLTTGPRARRIVTWSCISNARTDVAVMRNASALRPLPLKSKLELSFWISFRLNLFIWSKNEFHFAFWPFR